MNNHQDKQQISRELLVYALGELIILGLVLGGFALLGKLDGKVLLGGGIGAMTPVLNFFLTAVGVNAAANRAEAGDPSGGKRLISLSMIGRYLLMIAILLVAAKSGRCNVVAMVIPLALSRMLLYVAEFFRRKDG